MRELRRKKQAISKEESISILEKATSGTLALLGDRDYPYAVPMSYAYEDDKIYSHSALEGHKIDAIKNHSKASFCVIEKDEVIAEEYTTYYRSVIAFGKIRVLEEGKDKRHAIEVLAKKYSPKQVEGRKQEIDKTYDRFLMIELKIEHLSGKEAKELMMRRG